jgi:hypothetical protein
MMATLLLAEHVTVQSTINLKSILKLCTDRLHAFIIYSKDPTELPHLKIINGTVVVINIIIIIIIIIAVLAVAFFLTHSRLFSHLIPD